MNRREFLRSGCAVVSGASVANLMAAPVETKRFFTAAQRGGRSWLLTPEGAPFFSVALNHIDDAPLRYAESGNIWREKYANSRERWLKESVAPDLRAWRFNSVGWTQEVVVRGQTIHRHSPPFTFEEYQWLGLPYCHLLPFSEIHQWEFETRHPDFFSKDFEDWCDYVARTHCARMAGDGVKGGCVFGESDEFGVRTVRDTVHVHDLQATILHLLGLDHTRLTFRLQGRDYRLTDVFGNVVKGVLA